MANDPKDTQSRFYFTTEQLQNSPSRKNGMDPDQELQYRQRAANLIQDMGQRLHVSQLCINTAIVYMHRFYAFHSFTHFHRNSIAQAALFLAAKVEEQPRKLEHVIKVAHSCLNLEPPDPSKEAYQEQAQDLVFNENVLLQTLGFDVAIDHPHTHVVKTCSLVKASKELAQTSYFMASNSLHLTTMCLQYRPTVVACFCIHLACKWSRWEIPQSTEGKHWFQYVDKSVTLDLLQKLTDEFLHIFDKCPTRLKRLKNMSTTHVPGITDRKDDDVASTSSSSGRHHGMPTAKQLPPLDHKSQQRSSSSSTSSMSRSKGERPPPGQHMSSHATGGASGDQSKMMPHARAVSGNTSGSSSTNQYKSRSHSMPQSGQMKDRHSGMVNNSNGSLSHGGSNSIKSDFNKHDKMKINPAPIGLVNSASGTGGNQIEMLRKQQSAGSHMSQGGNQKHPHGAYMKHSSSSSGSNSRSSLPMHNKQQQQSSTQQPTAKMPPTQPQPQQQQPSIPPLIQPSFSLLDESALSGESLKTPPTAETKPKQSSIFSPEYMSTSSNNNNTINNNAASTTTTPMTVAPPPPRSSSGGSNNAHRNNSNISTNSSYNKMSSEKKVAPPPSLMSTGNTEHLDFLKQEKLGLDSQQSLPSGVSGINKEQLIKSESKKRPIEDVPMPDFNKMRRLEARLEGLPPDTMPPEELLAPTPLPPQQLIKSEPMTPDIKKERHPYTQPNVSMYSSHNMIGDNMKPRVVIPKLEKDERLVNKMNRPPHDTTGYLQIPPSSQILSDKLKAPPPQSSSLSVNGLETNPAVISSLLKESLFSDNSKHNTILPISDTPGPQLLSDPIMPIRDSTSTAYSGLNSNAVGVSAGGGGGGGGGAGSGSIVSGGIIGQDMADYHHKTKSEKKKKKEKHKHKDRTKDKEERKKHKKDKDRHRDKSKERHREHYDSSITDGGAMAAGQVLPPGAIQQHLKLTIKNPPGGEGSLKIKIPKEKIKPPESEAPKLPPLKVSLKNLLQTQPNNNKS